MLLFDTLDGLYAYDTGCTDSGIKDEQIRDMTKSYLESLNDEEFRVLLSSFIREYFVSDEQIKKGYGIDDVAKFIRWLEGFMDISF